MFCEKIFTIRMEKKLSRRELAKKVGVSQQFIQQLEKGKKNPSLVTAVKLAHALDCTLDRLLTDRDEPVKEYEIQEGR